MAIGSGCFFSVGYMILSGIAYYWNDWHEMMVREMLGFERVHID